MKENNQCIEIIRRLNITPAEFVITHTWDPKNKTEVDRRNKIKKRLMGYFTTDSLSIASLKYFNEYYSRVTEKGQTTEG